jgi:hypothetical protein
LGSHKYPAGHVHFGYAGQRGDFSGDQPAQCPQFIPETV